MVCILQKYFSYSSHGLQETSYMNNLIEIYILKYHSYQGQHSKAAIPSPLRAQILI